MSVNTIQYFRHMVCTHPILTVIVKTGSCRPRTRYNSGLVGRVEIES